VITTPLYIGRMDSIFEIRYKDKGDFFESYPDLLALREVQDLFFSKKGNGRNFTKEEISKAMWAIYFVYHHNSIWSKKPFNVRTEFVSIDFIGIKGWWEKSYPFLKPIIDKFVYLLDDAPERYLQSLYDKLDERNEMIKNTPYSLFDDKGVEIKGARTRAEWLDKMILNSAALVNEIKRVEATLHKTNDRIIKGGKTLTMHGKEELNGIKNEKSRFVQSALDEAAKEVS
jgi:hypothetical protein